MQSRYTCQPTRDAKLNDDEQLEPLKLRQSSRFKIKSYSVRWLDKDNKKNNLLVDNLY